MKKKTANSTSEAAASAVGSNDPVQAFAAKAAELWPSMPGLSLPLSALSAVQDAYVKQATELWNQSLHCLHPAAQQAPAPAVRPGRKDRRFAAKEWEANPAAHFMAQMYLLNADALMQLADQVQGDEKTRQRIRFAVQQWVDAAAPSNYLALNPEAQRLALETQGQSIREGLQHLWRDLKQGHVSQTDESRFEVGHNVATTEGAVVFENALFQLIEYKPLTAKVYERPLLIVPPCINKFYILDLQPENSLVRYAVSEGHRVFVISWRNPDESMAKTTWEDYVEQGVLCAISTIAEITGKTGRDEAINMLGFCVGGTLLATALAVLAARDEHPAASITLLTTFLDFSNTGVLDIFVDETMVRMREMAIGLDNPKGGALLKGQELASTFSSLRPNDLVWNYVVGNYLKGETPPAFDLLYWNSDSTNLPGPMYCWYLRNTYLENNLVKPNRLTVCGEPIDLRKITAPAYLYASREDHIVPWDSAYRSTQILPGKKRFVLGASGHIAGVINAPVKNKRSHWVGGTAALPADASTWMDKAKELPGSWWPDWSQWLAQQAGKTVPAPKAYGSKKHPVIEPAPGRYVRQKA